jgi:hypothetical protein
MESNKQRHVSVTKKQKNSKKAPTFEQDGVANVHKSSNFKKEKNLMLDNNIVSNTNFPSH